MSDTSGSASEDHQVTIEGVAHSDLFEITDVTGDPVNTGSDHE